MRLIKGMTKRAYLAEYREKNKEEINRRTRERYKLQKPDRKEYSRERQRKLRDKAIEVLGGSRCIKCGFSDIRALQIDHVNGNGKKEREKMGQIVMYKKIIDTNGVGYQILCANCNWIKRHTHNEKGGVKDG